MNMKNQSFRAVKHIFSCFVQCSSHPVRLVSHLLTADVIRRATHNAATTSNKRLRARGMDSMFGVPCSALTGAVHEASGVG